MKYMVCTSYKKTHVTQTTLKQGMSKIT